MKATFLFIAMLLFVNSSKDLISPLVPKMDTTLLEISKNPESEAVFATLAIQMESKSHGGFSKIQKLLTELVHDSRSQLHSMTKLWRGVKARCQVSKMKLANRQEFFEAYHEEAQRSIKHYITRGSECTDQLKGYKTSEKVYKDILKEEVLRSGFNQKHLEDKLRISVEGLESISKAHAAVKAWTPRSSALIQTHLSKVTESFKKINYLEIPEATALLERTTDVKVRRRLGEYLTIVHAQMASAASRFREAREKLAKVSKSVQVEVAKILEKIKNGQDYLIKAINFNQHIIKEKKVSRNLFAKLAKQNKNLIKDNNRYCKTEKTNYTKNRRLAESGIKLFKEVRNYFNEHYSKINKYIKHKYHKY